MAELSGLFLVLQVAFDGFEPLEGPVRKPSISFFLADIKLFFKIGANAGYHQRVAVSRRDEGEPADAGAAARVLRQERRLRPGLLEVLEDGERLEQRRPAVLQHERRPYRLRVHFEGAGLVVLAL